MKKKLVIGYGISGRASAALLKARGCEVIAVDRKAGELKADVPVLLDTADLDWDEFDQVILSPGVPPSHPLVQKAREKGIEVIGEIELAFRLLENRCVGITGSNGKTTTTLLIAHVLNAAGKKAQAVGNVGAALAGAVLDVAPEEILVIELSSFQLETLTSRKLDAAVCLNITPNHLDRHPTMRAYAEAKARIGNCLKKTGRLFISSQVGKEFSDLFREKEVEIVQENVAAISPVEYTQLGKQNVEAAFSICTVLGVSEGEFASALKTFRKPPHRLEWVAIKGGVEYFNDSKATNIHAVMHAVALMKRPVILIAGGVHKGASYRPWIESFGGKVRKILAFGGAASQMKEELSSSLPVEVVATLAEAVALAEREAKGNECVLLSPGCSSYDQFTSFEQRGDTFKRLVTGD
ncbi:MAG: UDP-N-acetylmuramoyl-L-alanine--D-glutamate ligase [Verrucomicrobiota bacterium]|nr:UDP-N-acetylmuramoyl-L-alanine--D-glutamate ligase [Verrucomicrobiota bacterium]